jgi:hypothetical protein
MKMRFHFRSATKTFTFHEFRCRWRARRAAALSRAENENGSLKSRVITASKASKSTLSKSTIYHSLGERDQS